MFFWSLLYNALAVPLLWVAFRVLALGSRKVRRGWQGRHEVQEHLVNFLEGKPQGPRLWIHASSMGEFEQAKPIIEELKRRVPNLLVIATFFSPSGLDNNLRYPFADHVTFIPFDTVGKARRFLTTLRPSVAVFIRYDLWPNHLFLCRKLGIPVLLANGTMRERSLRLAPLVRSFHRAVFSAITHFMTISREDAARFRRFGLAETPVTVVGDTRYDRVVERARAARQRTVLPESIREGKTVFVIGSSWPEDEAVLLPGLHRLLHRVPELLVIIVPHEPTLTHLDTLEQAFSPSIPTLRFSHLAGYQGEHVLLVDSIGILAPLYASADLAFVGGGFHSNVHNTLEPAVFGIPVLYGPRIANSQEAALLPEAGGAAIVRDARQLYRWGLRLIENASARRAMGRQAETFVVDRAGATGRTVDLILPWLEKPIS